MDDAAATPDFRLVKPLLELVRAAPGAGIHRRELEEHFGRTWGRIWPEASKLYRRRLIDFCGPYMVAAPRSATSTRPITPSAGVIMCGPRPPTREDLESVEAFTRELRARSQLQLVPSVTRLAAELADDDAHQGGPR